MKNKIDKLLKDSKNFIIMSEHGCYVHASAPAVLALFELTTNELLQNGNLDKEDLIHAINLAGRNEQEVQKDTLKLMKEIIERMESEMK